VKLKVAAMVLMACLASLVAAQVGSHRVSGTVRDTSGAVVVGAKVTVAGSGFQKSVLTDQNGGFLFQSVPEIELTVRVDGASFAPLNKTLGAQEQAVEITLQPKALAQEVNVTANRSEAILSETAESVSLLPREEIAVTAATTVDDVLRQIPGFTLFRRSGSRTANPTTQGVSLRGTGASGASRALVLEDGIPLNDGFGGWVYWGHIPREAIGSVEVLRGGASSLYGSDALGGVINVVELAPRRNLFSSEFSGGNESTGEFSGIDSWQLGRWNLLSSGEVFHTGGFILIPQDQQGSVDTAINSEHETGRFEVRRGFGQNDLFTNISFYNENRNNGTRVQINDTQWWQLGSGLNIQGRAGNLQVRGFGSGQSYNQTFSSVAANRNSEALVDAQHVPAQQAGGSLVWTDKLGSRNSLVAGADARQVRGFSNEVNFSSTAPNLGAVTSAVSAGGHQLSSGVFVQDSIQLARRVLFTAGGRYSNWNNYDARTKTVSFSSTVKPSLTNFTDDSEHAFSPRAALLISASDHVILTASAYRSFRAPTLNELYRTFRLGNTVTQANSQLRAERLSGAESGANLFWKRMRFHTAYFWAEISDPVATVTLSSTPKLITRQRQNLGRTLSQGVEADAEWHSSQFDIRAGYQFVNATIQSFPANRLLEGLEIPQVAPHQFSFQTLYRAPHRWTFAAQGRASNRQFDDDLNQFPLDAYFQMDAYVSKRVNSRVEAFTAIENIFNSRAVVARTPNVNLGSPILVRAGIKLSFE
jgi:outer membrane receptor protein involved in Fe transport